MDRASKLPLESPLLRFGPKAEVLAEALHMMSLSLVKMVLDYLAQRTATAGAMPRQLLTFGSIGSAEDQFFGQVFGVACSSDHKIWTLSGNRVQIFSDDGKFLHAAQGKWHQPRGIAFAADGQAYICDWSEHCVSVCRADGSFVRRVGSEGGGAGEFRNPCCIAVDDKQKLMFVSEYGQHRVSVLKLDGTFVKTFGSKGGGDGQLFRPWGVAVNQVSQIVAIADLSNYRIELFDYNGVFIGKFGSDSGNVKVPFGLAVDSDGNWIACDLSKKCVSVFAAADCSLINSFGRPGTEVSLDQPLSVCVAADGRLLFGCRGHVAVLAFDPHL